MSQIREIKILFSVGSKLNNPFVNFQSSFSRFFETQTMLQWMGGSRRKVTTSRKSTARRQKQYFEQRRRKQQLASGYIDQREHRSLDVLSLLNLASAANEPKSDTGDREDSRLEDSTLNYNVTMSLREILGNRTTAHEGPVGIKEAGSEGNEYRARSASPKIGSFTASDEHSNTCNDESDYAPEFWKAADEQHEDITVFDLLAEDGANGNHEQPPACEAHVAFSVEGLGNVGTETPVHSPPQMRRTFEDGCFSTQKAARRHKFTESFNDLLEDFRVDVMMPDATIPPRGSHSEFLTRGMNVQTDEKRKFSMVKDYALFDGSGSNIKTSFVDPDLFATRNVDEDLWDAGSSFSGNNFLNMKERIIPQKNWSSEIEETNFINFEEDGMSDYAFDVPHMQQIRGSVKAADRYNILGSPSRNKQTSDINDDFLSSKSARYPAGGTDFGFKDVLSQPKWSYPNDARDNFSSLSDESTSTSAVRGETTKFASNSMARPDGRRLKGTFESDEYTSTRKNIYVEKIDYQKGGHLEQRNFTYGSGEGMSLPAQLKPKISDCMNTPFQEKFSAPQRWLFKGHKSAYETSRHHYQTPNKKFGSTESRSLMEDVIVEFPVPESFITDNRLHSNSIWSNFNFNRPLDHRKHGASPLFSIVDIGPSRPDLSLNLELEGKPSLFHATSSHRVRQSPNLSAEERVSKTEENKSRLEPDNVNKFELEKWSCDEHDSSISENKNVTDDSNKDHSSTECKETSDKCDSSVTAH